MPTIVVGVRRDLISANRLGYIRHISLEWLRWELRFFKIKIKKAWVDTNDYYFLKSIERENKIE